MPEPPKRPRGRWLIASIVPALVGAGAALGVAAFVNNDAPKTVTVVERNPSSKAPAQPPARLPDPIPDAGGGKSVQQIVSDASPGVVKVSHAGGLGTGFLVDAEGHILTNDHVVEKATNITVTFADGTERDATLLAGDPSIDLAVLDIDEVPANARPLPLGQSGALVVGDGVVAIGNPLDFQQTATTGIVSALKRQICSPNESFIANAIQTDAAINRGNSGGPLLDRQGRVIGINSQIVSQGGGFEGIGFAVPIDTIRPVADTVIAGGKPQHAWIGIRGRPVTPDLAKELDVSVDAGVALQVLDERGPAKKAGLIGSSVPDPAPPKGGDVIVEIAGAPIRDFGDLAQQVASRKVGETVEVIVLRKNARVPVKLTLQDRPKDLDGSCS